MAPWVDWQYIGIVCHLNSNNLIYVNIPEICFNFIITHFAQQLPVIINLIYVPLLLGSYRKFHEATDWTPTIPFEQTMKDLFNYWMERLKK